MNIITQTTRSKKSAFNGAGELKMSLKKKTYIVAMITLLVITGLVSCERELGVLEPAPFPTDAEVFIDGFGPSVEPHSFLGTKLDALQVDDEEAYEGSQSIIITIPGPGDPSGSTWSGGALVAGLARDLSDYNALTFWAKASKALTLNSVGLGNDNEPPNPFVAEMANVPLTTNWTQYIIPIPLSEKLVQEQGLFYYSEGQEDGEGATIWLDEIKFENLGTIAYPSFSFASPTLDVYQNAIITIPSVSMTFNVDGDNVEVSASSEYLTFTSSDTSIVTVDTDGTLTAQNLGSATVYATLGDPSVSDSLVITVGEAPPAPETAAPTPLVAADSVVSIYSNVYTSATTPDFYTYWEFSTAEVQEVLIEGNETMQFLNLNFAGIDFSSQLVDASTMTHFHMDVWTPDPSAVPAAFKILLVDFGPDGVYGGNDNSQHELSITASSDPALVSDEWMQLDIPLSSFTQLTSRGHVAQLVISGDPNTVYIDNIYFYDSGEIIEPPPAGSGPETAAPSPTVDAADVVSIFSDAYTAATNPDWYTYWDGTTTQVEKQNIAGDTLMQFTALNWAGIDFHDPVDASAMTHFHVDVWTPDATSAAGSFNVKLVDFGADGVVGGSDNTEYEVSLSSSTSPALATDAWAQLDIPLSAFSGLSATSQIGQMVISGSIDTVYVDNVYFYDNGGDPPPPTGDGPSAPATTPTVDASDVISLFSNAYTDVAVDSWATGWEWSTAVLEDIQIAGDDIKLYTALNFNGIEFTTQQIDATASTHFHMDIWTPDPTSSPATFNVKLIDFGADGAYAGGDDSEHELVFTSSSNPALETGAWVAIDVPLTSFTGLTSRSHLAQMVISASDGLDSVYVDNVYFYIGSGGSTATEPESPATTPTVSAADVISLFSNAYTNVTVDNWATGWQWSTAVLEDIQITGDDVKLYTLLNFNGIEFTSQTIDATNMTHFHMDIWTPDATGAPETFNVKLIDFGANNAYDGGDDSEHELIFTSSSSPALVTGAWVGIDVPLSSFSGLTSRAHLAQMVISATEGLNTVYVDNIYFYR